MHFLALARVFLNPSYGLKQEKLRWQIPFLISLTFLPIWSHSQWSSLFHFNPSPLTSFFPYHAHFSPLTLHLYPSPPFSFLLIHAPSTYSPPNSLPFSTYSRLSAHFLFSKHLSPVLSVGRVLALEFLQYNSILNYKQLRQNYLQPDFNPFYSGWLGKGRGVMRGGWGGWGVMGGRDDYWLKFLFICFVFHWLSLISIWHF